MQPAPPVDSGYSLLAGESGSTALYRVIGSLSTYRVVQTGLPIRVGALAPAFNRAWLLNVLHQNSDSDPQSDIPLFVCEIRRLSLSMSGRVRLIAVGTGGFTEKSNQF